MAIRRLISHALLSSALLTAASGWAAAPQKGMLPGFLDPKTGAFTTQVGPTQRSQAMVGEAATYGGTLTMKFNITLRTGLPADQPIYCTNNASVSDMVASYSETKTVVATRSGSTATCSVSLFYSWSLSTGDQVVSQSYSVSTYGSGGVQREAFAYGLFVDMPVNGGSSSRTFNVTL